MTIPMLDAMAPILGENIASLFRLMGIAEEEIAEAIKRHPLEAIQINRAFSVLCPRMNLFAHKTQELYRHHAREILERVRSGEDTRPGTKAEVLAALAESSFASVLNESAHVLADRLMADIFPEYQQPEGWAPQEWMDGAADDALKAARRLVSDDSRDLNQKRSN